MTPATNLTAVRRRVPALAVAVAVAVTGAVTACGGMGVAQPQVRLNKVIQAIEEGRPAIANQDWRFVDMEHSPFSGALVQSVFAEMDQERDETGRLQLTPLVRIPMDGDEDFKWAIKQVLDLGGFGVIVPHVDTAEEAMRIVQAVRYPPARDAAQPEPRGERGWGPGGAVRLWRMESAADYYAKADIWPLNPDGELFAVAMIESAESVGNIEAILRTPISAIMVVPGDMSIDLGLGPAPGPENHPEVEDMFRRVLDACQAQDRVVCGLGDGAARLQQRIDEGWRFILPLGG